MMLFSREPEERSPERTGEKTTGNQENTNLFKHDVPHGIQMTLEKK